MAMTDTTPLDDQVESDFRLAANAYLESRHCTLWGEKFNVWDQSGRDKAVDWLWKTMLGIAELMDDESTTREP